MSRTKEIQVGITVIVSAAILILGLLWFKQVRLTGEIRSYTVEFKNVGGLKLRDRVQVLGIRRGLVAGVEQVGTRVQVRIDLDDDVVLYDDARIRLITQGIVGEKLMEIDPGSRTPVPENHIFSGRTEPDMAELTAVGAEALQEARVLNRELLDFLAVLRQEGRFDSTLSATRGTMENLRETSGRLGPDLEELTSELRDLVAALNTALIGPDSTLSRALGNSGNAALSVDSLSVQLIGAARSLAGIIDRLDQGKGTAGMLLNDTTLYAEAESTMVMIQDLVGDIKDNPKRYFHFSLF